VILHQLQEREAWWFLCTWVQCECEYNENEEKGIIERDRECEIELLMVQIDAMPDLKGDVRDDKVVKITNS